MNGTTLLAALSLMLIFEGLLPFVTPRIWRNAFRKVMEMQDGQIRFIGLTSMIVGLILLLVVQ